MDNRATFAGGCFWCMQPPFDSLKGVVRTTVGFTGGKIENPTYAQVCSGGTGHYEAIRIEFDPNGISYSILLDTFWKNIDPTQEDGQFHDRGSHYRTAIFYHSEEQRELAESSKIALDQSGIFDQPVRTKILEASIFYPAEEDHQSYYRKSPHHYSSYKEGSGRGPFIRKKWGGSEK